MPTFKTTSIKNASFVVSRLAVNMRTKKYCNIAKKFNMATAFLAITQLKLCLPAAPARALVSYACRRPLPGAHVSYACRQPLPGALVSYAYRQPLPGAFVSYALQK
jgi:hypothetical protein